MSRKLLLTVLATMVLSMFSVASSSLAASPAKHLPLTGTWTLSVVFGGNPFTGTAKLTQTGQKVSGTLTFNGSSSSFNGTFIKGMGKFHTTVMGIKIKLTGTESTDGKTMQGNWTSSVGATGTWTATRQ